MSVMTQNATRNRQTKNYIKAITQLIHTLSTERVIQIYEYAQSLQTERDMLSQPADQTTFDNMDLDDESWLFCSEEEMQEEDELWDQFLLQNQGYFSKLEADADAEIKNGTTQPMFDAKGQFVEEELVEHELYTEITLRSRILLSK